MIVEPTVRMTPGAYGPMLFAACPLCDWHGRKRDPNGRSRVKGQIRTLSFAESRQHLLAKHGAATLDDAIRQAKIAAGLDPDLAHLPALWADRIPKGWARLFWESQVDRVIDNGLEHARHNHFTRDIKSPGACPRCDELRPITTSMDIPTETEK